MSKIWYCPNCGYEISSRGRCHQCRDRLIASPLPELAPGAEEDEVGYRIEDWPDAARGWLIGALIDAEILHRFEDDELVVAADDEASVDDLIAEVATAVAVGGPDALADHPDEFAASDSLPDEMMWPKVEMLAAAAGRLRRDPTDMEADGEVAEASAAVFALDALPGLDADTWAAVGRVTRRLLAALGADDALEDEIRLQAGLLGKLLEPVATATARSGGQLPASAASEARPDAGGAEGVAAGDIDGDGRALATEPELATGLYASSERMEDPPLAATDTGDQRTAYALPEWLPEQRAQLSLLLDGEAIDNSWEGTDLLVPTSRESDVEGLFDLIEVSDSTEEEDEDRYRQLEELFAATDRLANAPEDEDRAADVVAKVGVVDGPTPLGFDDAQWWTIRNKAHLLVGAIDDDRHLDTIASGATELRDLLRAMV